MYIRLLNCKRGYVLTNINHGELQCDGSGATLCRGEASKTRFGRTKAYEPHPLDAFSDVGAEKTHAMLVFMWRSFRFLPLQTEYFYISRNPYSFVKYLKRIWNTLTYRKNLSSLALQIFVQPVSLLGYTVKSSLCPCLRSVRRYINSSDTSQ